MSNIKTILVFVELEDNSIRQVCTTNYQKQIALNMLVDNKSGQLILGPIVEEFKIIKDEDTNN